MKTKLLYFGALLALVACKKELEPQESTATTDSSSVVAPADPAAQLQQMVQQQQQPASQPAQTAPGTNPPHGQPGHRCDIAVGAPLTSAPAPTSNNKMVLSNPPANAGKAAIVPSPAASSTPVATAPGMNPPHGQPGHRCDIPVGQPLSSAGAAKATEVPAILAPPE